MSYVMKGDKLTQTAEPTTPEPTTQAESAFEEWCPVCGASAVVRLAPGWDDGRAIPIVGCGNPWHYATRSLGDVPEAEARNATGLVYVPIWQEWERFEGKAADRGSGATSEQMTGAAMMLSWLIDTYLPSRSDR